MSKQHCRMLQVERFFRQCRMLLRHCCWCGRGLSRALILVERQSRHGGRDCVRGDGLICRGGVDNDDGAAHFFEDERVSAVQVREWLGAVMASRHVPAQWRHDTLRNPPCTAAAKALRTLRRVSLLRRWSWLFNTAGIARGVYPPTSHGAFPPRWPDGFPQFLIIMNLILGPAIVSSLLLYLLLHFSCV